MTHDEFTDQRTLTPTDIGAAPRVRVNNAGRTVCVDHGNEYVAEETYLDFRGVTCVAVTCGGAGHDPRDNVLGWYPVPTLIPASDE